MRSCPSTTDRALALDSQTDCELIIRSYSGLDFHPDVFDKLLEEAKKKSGPGKSSAKRTVCLLGGGRIDNNPAFNSVRIFGFSASFGKCDGCNKAAALACEHHYGAKGPKVDWSDEI